MLQETVAHHNKYRMVYICRLESFFPVNSNIAYQADYTFYPEKEFIDKPEKLFDYHREILLQHFNASLVSEKEMNGQGFKAREMHFYSATYNLEYTWRFYFHNYILYRVGVTTEKAKSGNRFIEAFFKSFEMWE